MKSPTNIHLTSGQQENILSNSEADFEHYDLTVTMSELCVKGIIFFGVRLKFVLHLGC